MTFKQLHNQLIPDGAHLKLAALVTLCVLLAKLGLMYWTHQLALRLEETRYLIDAAILLLILRAYGAEQGPAPRLHTLGASKIGMLLAYANAVLLLLLATYAGSIAYQRLHRPETDVSVLIMIGAALLFWLNGTIVMGIRPVKQPAMSVRAMLIEMARDGSSSAGVLLTGAAVLLTHTRIGDPVVGLLTAVLMAWSSWVIVRENVAI